VGAGRHRKGEIAWTWPIQKPLRPESAAQRRNWRPLRALCTGGTGAPCAGSDGFRASPGRRRGPVKRRVAAEPAPVSGAVRRRDRRAPRRSRRLPGERGPNPSGLRAGAGLPGRALPTAQPDAKAGGAEPWKARTAAPFLGPRSAPMAEAAPRVMEGCAALPRRPVRLPRKRGAADARWAANPGGLRGVSGFARTGSPAPARPLSYASCLLSGGRAEPRMGGARGGWVSSGTRGPPWKPERARGASPRIFSARRRWRPFLH